MAIISSVALGKAQKSIGNVTFQRYYGKTVAKQKIVRNTSYVPSSKQELQRARMKYVFQFGNVWDGLADMLFVRSKWGTKRNNWVKSNYPAISAYVNDNESLILPNQGNNVSLIELMINKFTTYGNPVYVAKGTNASLNITASSGDYVNGGTPVVFGLNVVDNAFKKIQYRILYAFNQSTASPYPGAAPILSSSWKDLTLADGVWTAPEITVTVFHAVPITFAYIFQVMIDDMPATINATEKSAPHTNAVDIYNLPVA